MLNKRLERRDRHTSSPRTKSFVPSYVPGASRLGRSSMEAFGFGDRDRLHLSSKGVLPEGSSDRREMLCFASHDSRATPVAIRFERVSTRADQNIRKRILWCEHLPKKRSASTRSCERPPPRPRGGAARRGPRRSPSLDRQTAKLVPHPQDRLALGFSNVKPLPVMDSSQPIWVPLR